MTGNPVIEWVVERLGEVDSTNRVAAEAVLRAWEKGRRAEGIVSVADRQTSGQGQHGRRWESPVGGLYLSAVVEHVPVEARDRLALVAGLAVAEVLRGMGFRALIRWPNDIVIAEKKVAGILCEAAAQGERWAAVVGIGMNVTTDIRSLPPELQQSATSLRNHLAPQAPDGNPGPSPSNLPTPADLIHPLLQNLATLLRELSIAGLAPLIEKIRPLDALKNKRIRFATAGESFEATARGIDDHGRLLLERHPGFTVPHSTGTVNPAT